MWFIKYLKVNKFVFVDESGLNREYRRLYARAKRGMRVHDKKTGRNHKRTNIIAGLCEGRHIAVQCYDNSTTAAFFEDWFEFELIPLLPENALVIMDNARFHRKNALIDIAVRYGVYILFLPPYSPDLNPIEHSWANFKRWLLFNSHRFPSFDSSVQCFFDT
jgi:transposase